MVQPLWWFLKKLNIELPYDPAILLLGIFPKELKTGIQMDIHMPMFIVASFIVAKRWNQPKWPSTHEWINKVWYIHTMDYYSAIQINEVLVLLQHG